MPALLGSSPLYSALQEANRLAIEAGELVVRMAADGINSSRKADRSLVTEADLAADRAIIAGLLQAFPGDGILTEESGVSGGASTHRVWVVDPIDGTKAYAKQIPGYCVMIGLLVDGRPDLGVVYDPVSRISYFAIRGHGAWIQQLDQAPVGSTLSQRRQIQTMRLITTPSCPPKQRDSLLNVVGLQPGPVVNSVGIKVGLLIRGEGEVYYSHHGLSYWDTVAPLAIAREAGARDTLIDGSEMSYQLSGPPKSWRHETPLVVSNNCNHGTLLKAIRSALA